jgi:hypothetical protein
MGGSGRPSLHSLSAMSVHLYASPQHQSPRGMMWELPMGSSHRLPNRYRGNAYANRYPSNSPINRISMVTNNRNNAWIIASGVYAWVRHMTWTEINILTDWLSVVTWPQTSGKTFQAVNETTRISSVSYQDASDQLARTFPTVQFTCSHGTFCKSQCNQRQEQVGEDFSGNQPDQLSGFIWLHWTVRPIERASVKSNTPSSLPSSNAVKLLIMQVVYLQIVPIKVHTICNQVLIVATPTI